jgi:hypothetical protein
VHASDVVLAGFAFLGARHAWRAHRRAWCIAFGLLILAAVANIAVSTDRPLSAVGWMRAIGFIFAPIGAMGGPGFRRPFMWGFLVAMGVHTALGIMQFVTLAAPASTLFGIAAHAAWIPGDAVIATADARWLRAYGGFPHPNVFGTALLVALTAVAVAWQGAGARRPRLQSSLRHAAFIVFVFALVLTFSRAAWLGYLALLAVLVVRRTTRDIAIVGAAAFAVFLLATAPLVAPRIAARGALEERSIGERRMGVNDALLLSVIPPFFGTGLHAMPQALMAFDRTRNPYTAQPVHSVPLLAIAEIGWMGIALVMLALIHVFPRGMPWRWEWLALFPSLLFDHALWSLAVGPALVLAFVVVSVRGPLHPAATP